MKTVPHSQACPECWLWCPVFKSKCKQSCSLYSPSSSRSSLVLTSAKVLSWNLQSLMISPSSPVCISRTSCSTIKPHFIMLGDKTFPEESLSQGPAQQLIRQGDIHGKYRPYFNKLERRACQAALVDPVLYTRHCIG